MLPGDNRGVGMPEQWHLPSARPHKGQRWGKWRFAEHNLTLVHGGAHYEIDLETIDRSAEMLDWILQVSGKAWASRQDVGQLVRAFDEIFYPQANMCPGGHNRAFDAARYLRDLLKPRSDG
jgi:hypothetical protein